MLSQGFKEIIPVIIAFHFIFLSGGAMLGGFPLAFVVKKLYDRLVSRLPKKLLALSRKAGNLFLRFTESLMK